MFLQQKPFHDWLVTNKIVDKIKFTNVCGEISVYADGLYLANAIHPWSGFYFKDGKLTFENVSNIDPSGCVGQFSAVIKFADGFKAVNDVFGLDKIYLCRDDAGGFAITNRYEMGLRWLSSVTKVKFNTDHFLRGLFINQPIYSQRHSRNGDVENIYLVPLDEEIVFDNTAATIISKSVFLDLLNGSTASYQSLLDDAVSEMRQNLNAVYATGKYEKFIVDLSGGFDSRLILAVASSLPDFRNHIEISAHDTDNDLNIASTIVDTLGLSYQETAAWPQKFINIEDAYNGISSYNLGEYNSLGFPTWSSKGLTHRPVARLAGSCGELYRAIYLKEISEVPQSISALSQRFIHSQLVENICIRDTLADEFCMLPGDIEMKCELHYLYYRNRLHYGMRSWDWYHTIPIFMPALSINLFLASRKLPVVHRKMEKVMIDITNRLFPILSCFPYAAKVGFDYNLHEPIDKRMFGVIINEGIDLMKWKSANNKLQESQNSLRIIPSNSEWDQWKDYKNYILKQARNNISLILEHFPNLSCIENEINNQLLVWDSMSIHLCGKISSFAAQLKIANGNI